MNRTKSKRFLVIISAGLLLLTGFFLGRYLPEEKAQMQTADSFEKTLVALMKKNNIRSIGDFDSDKFSIIRKVEQPLFGLNSHELLTIHDSAGEKLFEFKDSGIAGVHRERLKPNEWQLVIESHGGGTDNFLTVFENVDNKYTEIKFPEAIPIRGGWWAMPQYRDGFEKPYFREAQIIAIQQIGGADSYPMASVYRFNGQKIANAGSISMKELGNSIESQLAGNKSK